MAGLIEFALGLASSTLSEIIKELVTGKKKAARMEEIEREVSIQIEKHSHLQQEQNERVLKIALEEFSKLVERNSGLKLSEKQVELKRRFEIPIFSPKISAEEDLKILLEQLNIAVLARRQELYLTFQSEEEAFPNVSSNIKDDKNDVPIERKQGSEEEVNSVPVEWKQVMVKKADNPVTLEINKMQERIYRRRSGEILSNEQ